MYVIRWIASGSYAGKYLKEISKSGMAQWDSFKPKQFNSELEAKEYITNVRTGGQAWPGLAITMYLHPLNIPCD